MNHKIIQTADRIEAFWLWGRSWSPAIAFTKRGEKWTCATSVCIPSDIGEARQIHAAMAYAFECLDEAIGNG